MIYPRYDDDIKPPVSDKLPVPELHSVTRARFIDQGQKKTEKSETSGFTVSTKV